MVPKKHLKINLILFFFKGMILLLWHRIINKTKIQLKVCLDSAFNSMEWGVDFTMAAIIEKDKADIIINDLALLSFETFKLLNIIYFIIFIYDMWHVMAVFTKTAIFTYIMTVKKNNFHAADDTIFFFYHLFIDHVPQKVL